MQVFACPPVLLVVAAVLMTTHSSFALAEGACFTARELVNTSPLFSIMRALLGHYACLVKTVYVLV